jgi:hypothetical protein
MQLLIILQLEPYLINFSIMLSDVTSPLLSPIRPFAYIMSYSGGAHKNITGTFTFFN